MPHQCLKPWSTGWIKAFETGTWAVHNDHMVSLKLWLWTVGCALLSACVLAPAHAVGAVGTQGAPLRLLYQERPPYTSQRAVGVVDGLLAAPVQQALERAGIVARWELTPSQRQLLMVQAAQEPQEPVCAVGWFRNPEREKLGRFSRPLYRDLPMGALVRADAPLADGAALAATLAAQRLTVLTKDGFSYGADIDQWLSAGPVRRVSTGSEPPQLVRMLLAGRADMMLVAPEEGQLLIAQHPPGALRMVRFSDVLPGLERHLYCSNAVPEALLRRLDRELERWVAPR